jgi:hypothetical protein
MLTSATLKFAAYWTPLESRNLWWYGSQEKKTPSALLEDSKSYSTSDFLSGTQIMLGFAAVHTNSSAATHPSTAIRRDPEHGRQREWIGSE